MGGTKVSVCNENWGIVAWEVVGTGEIKKGK